MPDETKTPEMPPKTEALVENVESETKERVRRISALTDQINRIQETTGMSTKKLSSEISTVTEKVEETKAAMAELEGAPSEDIEEMVPAATTILRRVGDTIQSLATGVKSITSDTARASSEAISQYGRAVSEDISINKQNVVAMSLARSTPIFGYFASKFMETDVFKNAATNIKTKLGSAISSAASEGGAKLRQFTTSSVDKIKSVFASKPKREELEEASEIPLKEISTSLAEIKEEVKAKPPKAQKGAYVEKGGIVEVHPAEIVMPIDKVLETIDKQMGTKEIRQELIRSLSLMSENMARIETFVESERMERKGIISDFVTAFQEARNVKEMTWQKRMLRALVELKVGLIGMTSRIRIAWQRTLVMHPTFRTLLMVGSLLQKGIISPISFLFGKRGKYLSEVRAATRTDNVFLKSSNLLGLLYSTGMFKLDTLIKFTKDILEFHTGKKAKAPKKEEWTMYERIKEAIEKKREKKPLKEKLFETIVSRLDLSTKALEKAGITDIKGFVKPGRIAAGVGITKEKIKEDTMNILKGFKEGFKSVLGTVTGAARRAFRRGKTPSYQVGGAVEETGEIFAHKGEVVLPTSDVGIIIKELKQFRIESKKSSRISIESSMQQVTELSRIKKGTAAVQKGITSFGKRIKKVGSNIWMWALMAFNMFKSAFGTISSVLRPLTGLITGGAAALGTAIAPFLGPILLVAMAGGLGVAVGTLLNKYLLQPLVNKWYDFLEKRTQKSADKVSKMLGEHMRTLRSEAATKEEKVVSREAVKITLGAGTIQEKVVKKRPWGLKYALIKAEQEKFIHENLGDYLKYGHSQVNMLREQWIRGGIAPSKAIFFESAEKYAKRRESSFLRYLKAKGTILSPEQLEAESLRKGLAGGVIRMKIVPPSEIPTGEMIDKSELVKRGAAIKLAESKYAAKEYGKVTKKVGEGIEKGAKGTQAAIMYNTNVISTAVSNASSIGSNQGGGGMLQEFSSAPRYIEKVISCNIR